MDELEEIRKRKLLELQKQLEEEQKKEEEKRAVELQIKQIISQVLTQEAKERLARIKLANPEYASQIELLLVNLAQQGRINRRLTDKEFKELLKKISSSMPKREFRIIK